MSGLTIPFFLVLTFTNTGAVQKYAFGNESECLAILPAVTQLYEGLKQPVKLECIPRTDIEPVAPPAKKVTRTKVMITYKETYKF